MYKNEVSTQRKEETRSTVAQRHDPHFAQLGTAASHEISQVALQVLRRLDASSDGVIAGEKDLDISCQQQRRHATEDSKADFSDLVVGQVDRGDGSVFLRTGRNETT